MVEEHQREQPACLRFLGGERELADEPDRLASQVGRAGRYPRANMPGRVDEVEHSQHDGQIAQLVQAGGGRTG